MNFKNFFKTSVNELKMIKVRIVFDNNVKLSLYLKNDFPK